MSANFLDGINITQFVCPKRSDLALYGNSQGVAYQYVEISTVQCNENVTTCMNFTYLYNLYKGLTLDLLYIDTDISTYGNVLKTAVTEYKLAAYSSLPCLETFELIPHYVDPMTSSPDYTFYKLNRLENRFIYDAVLEKALYRFEISNRLINANTGAITVNTGASARMLTDSTASDNADTEQLMPPINYALFILSQIGGLMYFMKCLLSPVVNYFNSKIFKHDFVNSWIRSKQMRNLKKEYNVSFGRIIKLLFR